MVQKETRKAFSKVKKEFEDHLESINENTSEIQSNYEMLVKLETRLDKLESSIADIHRFIQQYKSQNIYFLDDKEQESFTVLPLTDEEKRVFRVMYELDIEDAKITYSLLADLLKISTSLVREYVISLIEKGIPIVKNYLNQSVYLRLEPKFRDIQMKQNILNI
ncbi:hypothetical protein H6503_06420 [Candidatus Woesearchaeota archaeon]|nr:hypothetical protein [Candidatus Woesearchaeota archaeon]